ncbi:efflux RND transporter periplasmic adaptor subunit [Litorimonas taeanensis]|uniref:efflux RND transporter periplasmic adaptor subunit n=1 Tax=Litorimonas taeanensis TaxID=568099 RepID=UPI001F448C4E|nr:efflux RND transporter periplasmic adaptor subunit [Litorimonas taeanensis]
MTILTFALLNVAIFAPFANAQNSKPANVFAETVNVREFASRIEALGTLEPNEQVELTLNAADRVQSLYFDDGDRVREGQTLLSLAQNEQRALVEAEDARVSEAQQQLDRVNRLIVRNAVSQSEVDEAQRDLNSAKAQLRAVQSRQKDRVLVAPFDGILGFRRVSVGSYVQPGDVVARLIDDGEMNLEFSVPSTFLRYLKPGTPVNATTDDWPGEVFEGEVETVDNAIDPVTRTVKVRAKLPNPERLLLTGMFMEVTLTADSRSVPAIPEESVQPVGPRNFVYVIDTNAGDLIATKTEVQLGIHQDGFVEVLSGIQAGQKIVTEGIIGIRDGGLVKIQPKSILSPSGSSRGDRNLSTAAGEN